MPAIPILTRRREAQRRLVEDRALEIASKALVRSIGEAGTLEKNAILGAGAFPGSPSGAAASGSWSNLGGTMNSLVARVTNNLASSFQRPPEEIEQALAEQGMTWGPPFPPGRPLSPFMGYRTPPRTFNYPVGQNVQITPRWNRISFETIKSIYESYDVAQICVQHLINDVRSLDYNWEPIPGIKEDVSEDIEQATAFFASPDKRQPFRLWLAEWLQDVLRYDAGTLYCRRNMAGEPIAWEVVDGTTMIPLVDYFGRRPVDEDDTEDAEGMFDGEIVPAFVQIIQGLPWDWLAAEDITYLPWNPLPESQYGCAPLEKVLLSANCFSADTEVLTRRGWLTFPDVDIASDLVATRNPETQALEWQKATKFYEAQCEEPLYHFTAKSVDMLVTAGHRMLVDRCPKNCPSAERWGDGWRIQAEDLARVPYSAGVRMLLTSEWSAPDLETFQLAPEHPNKKGFTEMSGDDFAAFMGMWLAEGSCAYEPGRRNDIWISQLPSSKGFAAYGALLERLLGEPCRHDGKRFCFHNSALASYLKQFGGATEKYVPDEILNLSRRQLELFWDHYFLGDGCDRGSVPTITTSSKRMADHLQEVAQKTGRAASVRRRAPAAPGRMYQGHLVRETAPRWQVTLTSATTRRFRVERVEDHGHGTVYCVSVPNRVIYVRRNGYALWCGQTDIRFQWHFLQFFTEGTIPAGFMEAPPDLSDPAQVEDWQATWDAVMQGDQSKLRQIRWVPHGSKFTEAKPSSSKFDETFPLYLMRRTCAAYGCTPNDLGFTENVNRASGDTQVDVQFRVGTSPLLRYCEDVINLFAAEQFGLRCRIHIDDGKETEDRVATATADGIYIDKGVKGVDEVRKELGLHVDKSRPIARFVNNARTGPIPLLAIESMAGKIDAETYGPADSQPMVVTPFSQAPGPVPPQGSAEAKMAAEHTAQSARDLVESTTGEQPAAAAGEEEAGEEGAVSQETPSAEPGEDETAEEEASGKAAKGARLTELLEPSYEGYGCGQVWVNEDDKKVLINMGDGEGDAVDEVRELAKEQWPDFDVETEAEIGFPGKGWYLDPLSAAKPTEREAAKGVDNTGGPGVTHGVTTESGITGVDLLDEEDEDDEEDESAAKAALVALALRRWRDNSRSRLRKGQAPRRFVDPTLSTVVHDEVWAKLSKARTRAEVDAAFAAAGKARAGCGPAEQPVMFQGQPVEKLLRQIDYRARLLEMAEPVEKGVRSGIVSLDLEPGVLPSVPDGVEDHHITVVFLGSSVDDDLFRRVCARAAEVAASTEALEGVVEGTGTFPPSDASDQKVPVYAVPRVDGLEGLRAAFEEFNASEHSDFHPHVTLAYMEPDAVELVDVPATPVSFAALSVRRGDDVVRFSFGRATKAKAGPQGFHEQADAIVEHYAPLIAAAVAGLFSEGAVNAAVAAGYAAGAPKKGVSKAAAPDAVRAAVASALAGKADEAELRTVMEALYGDSFLVGAHEAALAAGGTIAASLQGVTEQLPDTYWGDWTPGYGAAAAEAADGGMRAMLDQADITIKGLADTEIDRIGGMVSEGLAKGDSIQSTGKLIREVVPGLPGLSQNTRSELIANTEYARSSTTASLQTYKENGVERVGWLAESDACEDCVENEAASPISIDDDWPNGDVPVHPRCFPGGTVVSAGGVVGSTARWYDGELVEIATHAGCLFAVTPNHPMLTSEGWVAAGLLAEGGDVVGCSNPERVAAEVDPHDHHGPALIEDVAVSLGGAGSVSAVTVPLAPEDLHGDGAGSEVCVVRTDRLLRDRVYAAFGEPDGEKLLGGRHAELSSLAGSGSLDLLLQGMRASTSCRVCGRSVRLALLPSSSRLLQAVGGGDIPDRNPTMDEGAGEGSAVDSKLAGELLDRFPGEVVLDPIVGIRRFPFSGHVYNLQTVSGWYIANGIIAHNCRCAIAPVVDLGSSGSAEEGGE